MLADLPGWTLVPIGVAGFGAIAWAVWMGGRR